MQTGNSRPKENPGRRNRRMPDLNNSIFTFLVGGKAGEGVKKCGSASANLFRLTGRNIFHYDDYQSMIKGGHNFSVVSSSTEDIFSHYEAAQLAVHSDMNSYDRHRRHITEKTSVVYNSDTVKEAGGIGIPFSSEAAKFKNKDQMFGIGAFAVLCSFTGMDLDELKSAVRREYRYDIDDNLAYAETIFRLADPLLAEKFSLEKNSRVKPILSGNEAIALGAAAAGLENYFSYPMTPSSSILHFLAREGEKLGITAAQAESEIAVVNMAIGSAMAGAKTMAGSSGGGIALMEEALSFAGMAEAPVLLVLSSRPGPSTGLATYTAQEDLYFALYQGHGEFPKIVASPGTAEEAFYLTAELMDLAWRFQTPTVLLTEKHLSESEMTVDINPYMAEWPEYSAHGEGEYKRYLDTPDGISPLLFPPSDETIKWQSQEHDEKGIYTENPENAVKMHDKRERKQAAIAEYLRDRKTVHVTGENGRVIMCYGSTFMTVMEALKYLDEDVRVVRPVYLDPFPVWELSEFKDQNVTVVEYSCRGQFAQLLTEKAGFSSIHSIRKYDGRPFDPLELAGKIKEART